MLPAVRHAAAALPAVLREGQSNSTACPLQLKMRQISRVPKPVESSSCVDVDNDWQYSSPVAEARCVALPKGPTGWGWRLPLATALGAAVAGGRVVATRAATIRRAARLLAEKWRA